MSGIIYSLSQRGKPIAIYNGYMYNFLNEKTKKKYWRCQSRSCRGRLLEEEGVCKVIVEHNHDFDNKKIDIHLKRQQIKEKTLKTNERTSDIVVRAMSDVKPELIPSMPIERSLKNYVNRIKNSKFGNIKPAIPDFPESLRINFRGDGFLQHDSGIGKNNRFVIFQTSFQKEVAEKVDVALIDGTFKSVPHGFYQLITVQGQVMGKFYPLCFILMENKTEEAYKICFRYIKEECSFKPKFIIIDFEKALINSLSFIFDTSKLYGCSFHFSQAVWKHVQKLGLTKDYKSDKEVRGFIRKLLNLVFYPIEEVVEVFIGIKNLALISEKYTKLELLFSYFEKNFVGTFLEREYIYPRYDIEFWSCYERIIKNLPRTTNIIEAWHRGLNQESIIAHPNIARFHELICKEEERTRYRIIQTFAGKNIEIPNNDLKKEYKLQIIIKNYELFTSDGFSIALENTTDWLLEN